jgi:DNA modification methylase
VTVRIIVGNSLVELAKLPEESVHLCATSPPYWMLRNYDLEPTVWGGDAACDHDFDDLTVSKELRTGLGMEELSKRYRGGGKKAGKVGVIEATTGTCRRCGAWRGALGLEPDPELFVEHVVSVFREVRRVLRSDGCCYVNIGDSYAGSGRGGNPTEQSSTLQGGQESQRASMIKRSRSAGMIGQTARDAVVPKRGRWSASGLKEKDLVGIPFMLALALRADGWYLRQDIVWCLSGGTWLYARTANKVGPMMLKDLARLKPETVELWNGERWSRVVSWTRNRDKNRRGLELVLRSGERIGCTDRHLWPTQRGNVPAGLLERGDVVSTTRLPDSDKAAGWLEAEAFWFAGLYLAEGSRSGATLQLAGHVRETLRFERVQRLVEHYGGTARVYNHVGKSQAIHVDSIGLSAVVETLIAGRTARDKRLSPRAWRFRNWALKALAEGYLEGDGHDDIGNGRIRLGFCRNYSLERDLRALAARLGATMTLNPSTATAKGKTFPSFKGEWRWTRRGHHNEKDRGEIVEIRKSRAREYWDVEVADHPNLFALASGVLTHNSKPNPMPESTEDRCTKSHEYLFHLSKSARYFYDATAIAEESIYNAASGRTEGPKSRFNAKRATEPDLAQSFRAIRETRNKRSVWTVATQPFPEAHFAVYPPALIDPCILAATSERGCCPTCAAGWQRVTAPSARYAAFLGRSYHDHADDEGAGMMQHRGENRQNAMCEVGGIVGKETETIGWYPTCGCDGLPALPKLPPAPRLKYENDDRDDREPTPAETAALEVAREGWRVACQAVHAARRRLCEKTVHVKTVPAVVLDPFLGAGTTALVADRFGRDCIGIEANPKYAEMAKRRLQDDAGLFSNVNHEAPHACDMADTAQ